VAGKQYEVVRAWRRTDPKTGDDTNYAPGDVYDGPVDKPYLLDSQGPDGQGPLIAEKSTPPVAASSGTPSKEK